MDGGQQLSVLFDHEVVDICD